ncbi:hypothetical protein FBZ93_12530 [Bradyrhizobium macuxiense]|uniref:Uncharacterized protein n=1 Tax=Bradyrhizobium macuxiense TaxID=1755647 RepID=A0A560KXS9_9BRAD|nr:hypothetical protein [Bradyrhizobium macuxiense]TWB86904.1 hypothetical protein FBZ93_12530 [Bradyrhizobium macuxiense]
MEGKIKIDDLITHTMPLDKINTAFDLMHEGKFTRVLPWRAQVEVDQQELARDVADGKHVRSDYS